MPIIAVGGILSGADAAAKIAAGASLVQIYTGFIYRGPELIREAVKALQIAKVARGGVAMSRWLLLVLTLWAPLWSQAAIETKTVEYQQGDTRLVGYLAYPKEAKEPRPGVLVVHEWMGLNDYAKRRAEQLAELGYVAFAADIYGDGQVAADRQAAGALSGVYKKDRALLRARVAAGLATLKAQSGGGA